MEFKDWLEKNFRKDSERKEFMKKHYIPDNISLEFDNFHEFYEERKKLISQKLESVLT
jgi:hypothetical protein